MSILKDSAVFKSSGLFVLTSPTSHTLPTKDNLMTNSHFFIRPSSRAAFNPRQIQLQQQMPHGHHVQQLFQEKLPLLPQLNQSQQYNSTPNAQRKNSLISKNMNTEQLKDWLIGKQPSQPNLIPADRTQNQVNQQTINTTMQMIASPSKAMENLNNNRNSNSNTSNQNKNQIDILDAQQTEQTQERRAVRRTQRRTQSDIIYQRQPPSIEPQQQNNPTKAPAPEKINNEDDSSDHDKSDENQKSEKTRIVIRKRHRMPSFNPTTVSLFEMNMQQKQQQNQQQQQIQQQVQPISFKQNSLNQQQPQNSDDSNLRLSRSTFFSSPNKTHRMGHASAEPSPLKLSSSSTTTNMESSQINFNKININSANSITIPTTQSQKSLTQRQILLKDLQNITDSRKLLEISSNLTPLNTKFGSSQTTSSQQDQLNQQIGKKLTIYNSPLSTASSPLDEVLSATNSTSSYSSLPLIKNRQIKNISLQNIEMPQKLQLHPSGNKSSVIQSVWGSSSTLESCSELNQAQPKGILKNKREPSKTKKSVVFDKKLHIHELDQQQQA